MPLGHNDGDLVYTLDNTDISGTETHDLPDVDGSEGTAEEPIDFRVLGEAVAKVVNDLDQSVDVRFQGTTHDDDGFAEPATAVTAKTINAGAVGYLETQTPWAYLRTTLEAAADPTSGQLKIVFELKHSRD